MADRREGSFRVWEPSVPVRPALLRSRVERRPLRCCCAWCEGLEAGVRMDAFKCHVVCFCSQEASPVACPLLSGGRPLPIVDVKPPEGPSSKSRDHPPREEEKEKKKKKHKKRSRTRSRSPKYHSSSKSRSRSHSKAKHSLPSAYRTARRSRWVCECLCGGVRPEAQVRASGGRGVGGLY